MRPCSLKWPPISEYISLDELVLGDWLGAATACGDCCGMAAPFGFNFQCCETATLRQVEFYVDPENPPDGGWIGAHDPLSRGAIHVLVPEVSG